MTLRRRIIGMFENELSIEIIIHILKHEDAYKKLDMFEALGRVGETLSDNTILYNNEVIPFDIWLESIIYEIKKEIESNNDIFKDISKHDIISSREHTMQQNVNLSNELYHLKNYVKQLENEKIDLQIKLERARNCDMKKNVYCYECEDNSCVNNIYYKNIKNGGS